VARNGDEDRSGRSSRPLRKLVRARPAVCSGSCQNACHTRKNARQARVPWPVGRC